MHFKREMIEEVVEKSNKKRFEISDDDKMIRASYGHSIPVDLDLNPQQPPELLYHGTAKRILDSIKDKGLIGKGRNFVHLSIDKKSAFTVGNRHGKPVILTIYAGKMYNDGFRFYCTGKNIWLVEKVPWKYIDLNNNLA